MLASLFLVLGTGWTITNLSAGLPVVDPSMETNNVASWIFLSYVLCVFLPYCVFVFYANFVPLRNHDPELTTRLRPFFFMVITAFVIGWALLARVYAFRRFPKRPRRVRSPCRLTKAVVAFFSMGLVGLGSGLQWVFVFCPAAQKDEPYQTIVFQFGNVALELERVPVAVLRRLFGESESHPRSDPRATPKHVSFTGLESFVRFFRQEHFVRYQMRAQIRILVSLVMIFVPLVCSSSNVSYYAAYPRGESILTLLLPGLMFFVKDIVEWYLITWRVMLRNDQCVSELLPALFDTICCSGGLTYKYLRSDGMAQLIVIGTICGLIYCCDLLYSLRWTPFNLSDIHEATGYSAVQWSDIYDYCENA
eukprot:g1742.t1